METIMLQPGQVLLNRRCYPIYGGRLSTRFSYRFDRVQSEEFAARIMKHEPSAYIRARSGDEVVIPRRDSRMYRVINKEATQ